MQKGELLFTIDPRPFEAEVGAGAVAARRRSRRAPSWRRASSARAKTLLDSQAISRQEFDQLDVGHAHLAGRHPGRRGRAARRPAQPRVHPGARADRRSRLARQHHRRQPRQRAVGADHDRRREQGLRLLRRQRADLPAAARRRQRRRQGAEGAAWAWPTSRASRTPARSTSSTTGSTRRPARSACAPASTTPRASFTPGLAARLRMEGTSAYDAVLVPDRAIGTDQTKKFVYVVGAGTGPAAVPRGQAGRADRRHAGRQRQRQGRRARRRRRPAAVIPGRAGHAAGAEGRRRGHADLPAAARPAGRRPAGRVRGQGLSAAMDISRFFIDRPRFAGVISIFIFLIGLLAIVQLPVSEYPEVAPPQIVVRAQFPGANPRVISETVATPLEEQINGVENLLYFDSQASADGSLTLTVTFKIGTNPEVAETAVQNRINRALPRAARHRAPDRRDDREVEPEPDDGGPPGQPRQQPRRALPAQLRPAQRPRRAAAHSRHGLGDPVRRRRLRDARLARPGQARRAQHHQPAR